MKHLFIFLASSFFFVTPLQAKDLWPWPMLYGNALNVVFPDVQTIRVPALYVDGSLFVALTLEDPQGVAVPVAMQVDTAANSCLLKKAWAERLVAAIHLGAFIDGTVGQPEGELSDLVTIGAAHLGPVEIRPFVLFTNSLVGLRPQVEIEGRTLPVVGLLGSNVVFRRSLHLNLAQNVFVWETNDPLRSPSVRSLALAQEQMGMGPVYLVVPHPSEEGGAVLDTGAYSSLEPLDTARSLAAKDPQRWILKDSDEGTIYYGLREQRTILGRPVHQGWSVGMQGVGQPTWGTQILSLFDLWFDLKDEDNPRLWFTNVESHPRTLDPAIRMMPPEFSSLLSE